MNFLVLNFHKGFASTAPSKCNDVLREDLPPCLWSEVVTSFPLLSLIVMYLFIGDSVDSFRSLKILVKKKRRCHCIGFKLSFHADDWHTDFCAVFVVYIFIRMGEGERMRRLVGWRRHRAVWENQNAGRRHCGPPNKPATGSAGSWNWASSEYREDVCFPQ